MKKYFFRILLCVALAAMLVCTAAANETDTYGYYDYDADGRIEITDALSLLRACLNDADSGVSLIRVLRSLKAVASTEMVSGTVTDAEDGVFTVTLADASVLSVPCDRFGISAEEDHRQYRGCAAILSRGTADARIYAASVDYVPSVLLLGSVTATAGSEVQIPVLIKDAHGIAGAQIELGYDSTVMTYVTAASGKHDFYFDRSAAGANPIKLVLANMSLKPIMGDIDVGTVTLGIAADAPAGTYTVTVSKFEAYDEDVKDMPIAVGTATVTVE